MHIKSKDERTYVPKQYPKLELVLSSLSKVGSRLTSRRFDSISVTHPRIPSHPSCPRPSIVVTKPHERRLYFMRCRRTLKTLKSASAESGKSSPAAGDERWGRKANLGFSLQGAHHVTDPTKDQPISSSLRGSSQVVPRGRKAPVVPFDTSTPGEGLRWYSFHRQS